MKTLYEKYDNVKIDNGKALDLGIHDIVKLQQDVNEDSEQVEAVGLNLKGKINLITLHINKNDIIEVIPPESLVRIP